MKDKLKCPYCGAVFEIDKNNVSKTSKYLQCPVCGDLYMKNIYRD